MSPSRFREAWYIPSFSGDYRLEAHPDDPKQSQLGVLDPMSAEVEVIERFLKEAQTQGWIGDKDPLPTVKPMGVTVVNLSAPIVETAPVLVRASGNDKPGRLTVVKSIKGVVAATKDVRVAVGAVQAAAASAQDPRAVTTRRATPCCPNMVPGREIRASEVLRAFSTEEQWAEWTSRGYLHCVGGYTGRLYRLVHRHNPLAAEQGGKICFGVDDGAVLHFHDTLLPPPEEVLAAKLILEHREDWLRNGSTCIETPIPVGGVMTDGFTDVFRNPLGPEYMDGVADSGFTHSLGVALKAAMPWWRAAWTHLS